MENPLLRLTALGQSIWMDFLRREMITSGELQGMIDQDGLRGITSNPAIFEKAIVGAPDYDEEIKTHTLQSRGIAEIYEAMVVKDIQMAADLLRPVYERTDGADGFVSLEVSPHLAHDTDGTIVEARRLWSSLARPNVMIKVPGTREGLPAIRRLISEGININVTLLFGLPRYQEVAEAFISGLEERERSGGSLDRIASVASFFLSRIDVLLDPVLEKKAQDGGLDAVTARGLQGQIAIASAKMAYQIYKEIFGSDRFQKLAATGARPQRLLWASTSTKNPAYSDVKYVEPLIGMDTVNTMPPETIDAYRDHGDPALRLEADADEARKALEQLPRLGIDIDQVTQQLEDEGVDKFVKPFDLITASLIQKRDEILGSHRDSQPQSREPVEEAVWERLSGFEKSNFGSRLWQKDASIWKDDPVAQAQIRNSLGWMTVAEAMVEHVEELKQLLTEVKGAGFRHVVHMGMGGSSLAPLVFQRTFGVGEGGLPLTVLDTTDPATVLEIERSVPLGSTIFIVASKSGTTAEPSAFGDYFFDRACRIKRERGGENFIAITDPSSALEVQAGERNFHRVFPGAPDIGGRYSALSYFGLVPAALMGMDVGAFLDRVLLMARACGPDAPPDSNPALVLGATLGEFARAGKDKLTFLMPRSIDTLGLWLEQLIAESTGKEGTGILPVAGEPFAHPRAYGRDRLFIHYRIKGETDEETENQAAALAEANQPVVTIEMEDRMDLGQEMFRWEMATAVAGAVLGINPFDQPNVQESKDYTNRLLAVVREQKKLPEDEPSLRDGSLSVYAETAGSSLSETLGSLLAGVKAGDYLALLAYLTENEATERALQSIRLAIGARLGIATTCGYGPRYLHSTGQFHKGGPNTGIFIELTADEAQDVPIPGQPYSFGVFKRAQALGDMEALRSHGRRVIRIHLGSDVAAGLAELEQALNRALAEKGEGR